MSRAARSLFLCALLAAGLAASAACRLAGDLWPHTYATSTSPDGRHTASVWRAFSIDPPADHLLLASEGRAAQSLMSLAPDADWCRSIIWTPDSRTVGFVVADDRLAVFDVETRSLEAFFFLAGTGCCGGPLESRNVAFNADGTEVSFDRVERAVVSIRGRDGQTFEAHVTRESPAELVRRRPLVRPAVTLGRETVRVPTSRWRLRLVPSVGQRLPSSVAVTVVLPDQRALGLDAAVGLDGLVVLPPVHDGPVERLEVGVPGLGGGRIIVPDVRAAPEVTIVDLPLRAGVAQG